jgi:hypothetical protein
MIKNLPIYFIAFILHISFTTILLAQHDNTNLSSAAEYKLTFSSTWSSKTHPLGFPVNPHYSGLIGMTHKHDISLWEPNKAASAGIKLMAETGRKSSLIAIIDNHIVSNNAETIISGQVLGNSPAETSVTFKVTENAPYVSVVCMLAPSPDWFVGVTGLHLKENGEWVGNKTIDLILYDAGTDSGTYYAAINTQTLPKGVISPLNSSKVGPFTNGTPSIGTFKFKKISQPSK